MPGPSSTPTKTRTIILAVTIVFAVIFAAVCCTAPLFKQKPNVEKTETSPISPLVSRTYNGIDVSHHQKNINWDTVGHYYSDSLDFVYIKATEGKTYVDELFQYNIKEARKAGFHTGAYHYFSMKSSAHEQFDNFRNQLDKTDFNLIPMVDVELDPKNNIEKKQLQDSLEVFICLVKKQYGVAPIIYGTNKSINRCCAPRFNNYLYYVGRYGSNPPIITQGDYAIWQYSEKGKLKGIPKSVDLCKFHPDHSIDELLMPSAKKNGQQKKVGTAGGSPVTIKETDSLIIYYPNYKRIDLVTGIMPDKRNDVDVIYCCEAAYTGECLTEFRHSNIAGDHVSSGKRYSGYRCTRNTGSFV